jgi:hypothetical protein
MEIIRTTARRRRDVKTLARDKAWPASWQEDQLCLRTQKWTGSVWENFYVLLDEDELQEIVEKVSERAGTNHGKRLSAKLAAITPKIIRLLAASAGLFQGGKTESNRG